MKMTSQPDHAKSVHALLEQHTEDTRRMAGMMINLARIETTFRKFRGAGDRKCACDSTILKMYGCQCGKQAALDLARIKLFAILDDIFPRDPDRAGEDVDLLEAVHGLIEYRQQAGPLNFQLEKADTFIFRMRVALEAMGQAQEPSNPDK